MSFWTSLRDAVESVASVVGNYFLPGSGAITSQLVSKGAQQQLGSGLGQLAMIGSGIGGVSTGNLANYGSLYDAASGVVNGAMGATPIDPSLIGADQIETLNNVMQSTGTNSAGAAAQALGYTSPEAMLYSINPSWGSPASALVGQLGGGLASYLSPGAQSAVGQAGATPLSGLATPGNLFSIGSGVNNILRSRQLARLGSQLSAQADPWGASGGRGLAGAQLRGLLTDPSSITSLPGYQAGLEAVQRSMAAQGYMGSGNMMAALQKYGGDFYNNAVSQLSGLAGAGQNPAAGASLAMQGALNSTNLANLGLQDIGIGLGNRRQQAGVR